ncbi:nucleoside kinase [Lachnospiraceae bacterium NSJ-143]|nr:nucleoside kinase [Lachnospiraceae bacterium NSJ-143]
MEDKIFVTVNGNDRREIKKGTTFYELSKSYKDRYQTDIMLAKSGNVLYELSARINKSMDVEFIDLTNQDGVRVYSRSLSFIMVKAIKDLFGIETKIFIEHSINGNLYCEVYRDGVKIDNDFLLCVKKKMMETIEADLPIERLMVSVDEATELASKYGMEDKIRLLAYRRVSYVSLYRLENLYDYYYGYMLPFTGLLKIFDLSLYEKGFLLRMPSTKNPNKPETYDNFEKISAVFMEQLEWCKLMEVKCIADLNDVIADGSFAELVRINEALHEKKIAYIADKITENFDRIKVVLIAGPSSSGKTSFAQRLCVQLRVNGIKPHAIGMDDYFLNRDQTPLGQDGRPDFESLNALDLHKFNNDINNLINGREAVIPSYDFITGKRSIAGRKMKLRKGEIIVIEGIHGLNTELTRDIPEENKFRIFVSPMTQLNIDAHNCISTSDSRLIRRIVRDFQFRGNTAAQTIDSWPNVRRGEEQNIFPYQQNADIVFNSATIYELSVLKAFIVPLLYKIDKTMPEYITANRILKFLEYFLCAGTEAIPDNSLLKEFVGGSVFNV